MLTVEKIRDLERDRYDAMRAGDVARLSVLFADDLVYGHSNAQSDTKREYLRKIEDGSLVYHAITISDVTMTLVGDTALVSARMTADVSVAGVKRAVDSRALAVWVDTPDGCKLFAYQPTVIPRP